MVIVLAFRNCVLCLEPVNSLYIVILAWKVLPLSVVVLEKSFFLPELGSLVSILILHSVSH